MDRFYPQQIIDEQNEDLDTLSKTLESLGVKVYRPDTQYANEPCYSPTWHGKIGTTTAQEIRL